MTLDSLIETTENELAVYKKANFADPNIILWLEGVLENLLKLRSLT